MGYHLISEFIHYVSDTPLSKGRNLGAGTLSYYGMDSTYASTSSIIRRIFELEKLRNFNQKFGQIGILGKNNMNNRINEFNEYRTKMNDRILSLDNLGIKRFLIWIQKRMKMGYWIKKQKNY